jgi:uncharacterized damage-inducible protein DinB
MESLLRDLLDHRAWADAEHVRAIAGHASAATDPALLARLHHTIAVQRVFLGMVGCRVEGTASGAETPALDELIADLRTLHQHEHAFVGGLAPAALEERVAVPHFRDPPLALSRAEALAQSAMHSQHHRAQNATRLRELGAVPPTTDLIVWYWRGRPAPEWEGRS